MDTAILTLQEAAALLKVDARIVKELLNDGELPGRLVGGEWRTTARAIASWVDGVPLVQAACCVPGEGCCQPGQGCC